MPHPIETWVRETERSQRRADRQRLQPSKGWRPQPLDYPRIAGQVVLAVSGVLALGYMIVRVVM